jgi:hypothetical protein
MESVSHGEPVRQVVRYQSCSIYRVLEEMVNMGINHKGFGRIFLDLDNHTQYEFDKLMSAAFFTSVLRFVKVALDLLGSS